MPSLSSLCPVQVELLDKLCLSLLNWQHAFQPPTLVQIMSDLAYSWLQLPVLGSALCWWSGWKIHFTWREFQMSELIKVADENTEGHHKSFIVRIFSRLLEEVLALCLLTWLIANNYEHTCQLLKIKTGKFCLPSLILKSPLFHSLWKQRFKKNP